MNVRLKGWASHKDQSLTHSLVLEQRCVSEYNGSVTFVDQ